MLTFVWDVDDVLNELMCVWFAQAWLPAHPECRLAYSDILENPPHRVLGISESEYFASLDAFRLSETGRGLQPNALILDWLGRYGPRHRHMALTARPLESAPYVAEWVVRHFGNHIRCFGVVPSRLREGEAVYDASKHDFLRWFGRGDVLIDDSAQNIAAAQALGMRGVLYPQPWNRSGSAVEEVLWQLAELAETH